MIIKLILFAAGTLAVIFITLHSADRLRTYGLLRFFDFESIVVLILYNAEHWFQNPFSVLHIISWLLIIVSVAVVSCGFYMLRRYGQPKHVIDDTASLVTSGIYRYIRHPLYSSLIFLACGAFLKDISVVSSILVLVTLALTVAMARIEEQENIRKFGAGYTDYMKTTKMFIPFVI